jgi:hypothetical protein
MSKAKAKLERVIKNLGLTIESTFVPWSQSRRAGEKHPSLNWKVRLLHNGKLVAETDYSAGCGHCPSYQYGDNSVNHWEEVRRECETGKSNFKTVWGYSILLDTTDVIYSLVMDSDALNYPTYEEWASEFGYDPDSRKGEAIYRQCLEIALKLRSAIGEDGLKRLNEASQDY